MLMEVILKKPVASLGAEADIVKVRAGYARNFLIPQGIAITADAASKKQIESLKKARAERETKEMNDAQDLAKKMGKITLTFKVQSNDEQHDKIFGSITSNDIAKRLKEEGYEVDRKKVKIEGSLRKLGEQTVEIDLGYEVFAKIKVILEAPEAAAKEERPAKKGKKDKASEAKSTKKEQSDSEEA
jgi:large subunit ribosomal protein L9